MKRLDRILAVLDPTSRDPAGARQGRDARAPLRAPRSSCSSATSTRRCPASRSSTPTSSRQLREEFVSERLEYLEEAAEELRAEGLAVETHVHWDNPHLPRHRAPGRGVVPGPRGEGHPLPHGAAAHAVHQHRLEPDPHLPGAAAARQAGRLAGHAARSWRPSIPGTSATSRRRSTTTSWSGPSCSRRAWAASCTRCTRSSRPPCSRRPPTWPACRW